jgi:hypothetical protein
MWRRLQGFDQQLAGSRALQTIEFICVDTRPSESPPAAWLATPIHAQIGSNAASSNANCAKSALARRVAPSIRRRAQ